MNCESVTETKVLGLLENIYLPVTVISSFPYCSMQVQQSDEQAWSLATVAG